MKRLEGKTAIVTGASRGIGRAIAIELAREGALVAVVYQSNDVKAQEVAAEISKHGGAAMLVKANVANSKEAHEVIAKVAEGGPARAAETARRRGRSRSCCGRRRRSARRAHP